MKLYCSANEAHNTPKKIYKTREFNRAPDETYCTQFDPDKGEVCGGRFETGMERNARKKAKNPMVTMECPNCGRGFERRRNRPGTGLCESCARRTRPLRVIECVGCGSTFETREPEKRYCTHRCFLDLGPGPTDQIRAKSAEVGRGRTGAKNPNFRHGSRAGEHERRLAREFNLTRKDERVCRVCACAKSKAMQAHHAVPRSMALKGKYDLRNCLPLCAHCHASWHRRTLTIYRDIFTEKEWAFVRTLATPTWLEERYPDRGHPFREEGLERVPADLMEPIHAE